jgi:hypothetical protein
MLAAPLVVGAVAAGPARVHLLLAAFWFTGYLAFFATGVWLKSRRAVNRAPMFVYAAAAAVLGLGLAVLQPGLLRWAPLFLVPLGVGLWASATRHERSLLSGLATTTGSALMTVVAYDAGGGQDWRRAWLLTAIMVLYFAGTVFYVKTVIRRRGNRVYRALSVGWHVLSAALLLRLAPWVAALMTLLAVRAALVPRRRGVTPKQVGIGEIAATVVVSAVALLTT